MVKQSKQEKRLAKGKAAAQKAPLITFPEAMQVKVLEDVLEGARVAEKLADTAAHELAGLKALEVEVVAAEGQLAQAQTLAKGRKMVAEVHVPSGMDAEADGYEPQEPDAAPPAPSTGPEQDLAAVLVPEMGTDTGAVSDARGEADELAPAQPAAEGKAPVLHVKQGLALRGGRGEWYKLLCKYDGKPVAEYVAAGKANPASHYTARSTKCGQPKTPESRLSWFKRAGIVTIS